jgi:LysM repeat protein
MKKSPLPLPLGMLILLIVASLLTGCFREAAPDVTETPAGAQQADQPEGEGTPDIMATGMARSAELTAEASEGSPAAEEAQPTETPTPSPAAPTSTPTPSTTAVPTFTPSPATSTPTPVAAGETTHTVQPGENLFRIALRYNTTVEAIASANGIANPALIYVGQQLTISSSGGQQPAPAPGGTTYVVQPGDNLFRIALRYNMSYITLAQYNNIANPASIYVGQVIHIP